MKKRTKILLLCGGLISVTSPILYGQDYRYGDNFRYNYGKTSEYSENKKISIDKKFQLPKFDVTKKIYQQLVVKVGENFYNLGMNNEVKKEPFSNLMRYYVQISPESFYAYSSSQRYEMKFNVMTEILKSIEPVKKMKNFFELAQLNDVAGQKYQIGVHFYQAKITDLPQNLELDFKYLTDKKAFSFAVEKKFRLPKNYQNKQAKVYLILSSYPRKNIILDSFDVNTKDLKTISLKNSIKTDKITLEIADKNYSYSEKQLLKILEKKSNLENSNSIIYNTFNYVLKQEKKGWLKSSSRGKSINFKLKVELKK